MFISNNFVIKAEIEDIVKKERQKNCFGNIARVMVGRRLWLYRHCGARMILVKVFYENKENPNGKSIRGTDEYVCPKCYHHFTDWSDFFGLIE